MIISQRNTTIAAPAVTLVDLASGIPGSSSDEAYHGTTVRVETDSAATREFLAVPGQNADSITLTNLTPGVCDITAWPVISHVAEGVGKVKVDNGHSAILLVMNFPVEGGLDHQYPIGFEAGGYGEFSYDLLSAKADLSNDLNLFTGNPSLGVYNSSCWVDSYDFSGVAIWNSRSNGAQQAGTAITSRHLACSWHYKLQVGDTVKFATPSGEIVTRTVIGSNRDVGPATAYHSNPLIADRCVVVLSADLPEDIAIYPVMDSWFYERVGATSNVFYSYAGITLNQYRKVSPVFFAAYYSFGNNFAAGTVYEESISESLYTMQLMRLSSDTPGVEAGAFVDAFSSHYVPVVVGDSGCPTFLPLSGTTMALAATQWSYTDGPFWSEEIANACIKDADADAVARGSLVSATNLTVTVATDPTA